MRRPREHYIYFVKPRDRKGPIKIGCSYVPKDRLKSFLAWSPFELEIVATVAGDFSLERNIHDCFFDLHLRSEWFRAGPRLLRAIEDLKRGKPVDVAIDLSDRRGSISSRKNKGRRGLPGYRTYSSYLHRLRFLWQKHDYRIPDDVEAIMREWHSNDYADLPAEKLERLDEVLKDPKRHCESRKKWLRRAA